MHQLQQITSAQFMGFLCHQATGLFHSSQSN